MKYTQNKKIAQLTKKTLIVGWTSQAKFITLELSITEEWSMARFYDSVTTFMDLKHCIAG